jgi:hypothetical protein
VFHDLRRTAVWNLKQAGVHEKEIMLITGHRSRRIFDRHYNVMQSADIHTALAQLGALVTRRLRRHSRARVGRDGGVTATSVQPRGASRIPIPQSTLEFPAERIGRLPAHVG